MSETRVRASLEVDTEVFDAYAAEAAKLNAASKNGHVSPERLMVMQLSRFQGVPVSERVLVISAQHRERLEHILAGRSFAGDAELVEEVEKLANLEIGGIRVDFTPAQLAQLKRFATRNHISVGEAVRRTVKAMEEQFFDLVTE